MNKRRKKTLEQVLNSDSGKKGFKILEYVKLQLHRGALPEEFKVGIIWSTLHALHNTMFLISHI